MKKTGYERWKASEKINKAPWVLRYYENITDMNQYKHSKIVERRLAFITMVIGFVFGIFIGVIGGKII